MYPNFLWQNFRKDSPNVSTLAFLDYLRLLNNSKIFALAKPQSHKMVLKKVFAPWQETIFQMSISLIE